jgi:hypothetical protein
MTKPDLNMKKVIVIFSFLTLTTIISCDDGDSPIDRIIGKWKLVKMYSFMTGSFLVHRTEQNIDEYRINKRIVYDYTGVEVARCDYHITDSKLTYSGTNANGEFWDLKSDYWMKGDTLVIRGDGGFEYTDVYWVRVE